MNRNDMRSSTGHIGLPNTVPIDVYNVNKGMRYENVWRPHGRDQLIGKDIIILTRNDNSMDWEYNSSPVHQGMQGGHNGGRGGMGSGINRMFPQGVRSHDGDFDTPSPTHSPSMKDPANYKRLEFKPVSMQGMGPRRYGGMMRPPGMGSEMIGSGMGSSSSFVGSSPTSPHAMMGQGMGPSRLTGQGMLGPATMGSQEMGGMDSTNTRDEEPPLTPDPSSPFPQGHPPASFHQVMSTMQSNDSAQVSHNRRPVTITPARDDSRSIRQQEWINLPWIRKSIEFADKARESE